VQMYCTFVLFVNQHFPGLPASGTHCIILNVSTGTYETIVDMFQCLPYLLSCYGTQYRNCMLSDTDNTVDFFNISFTLQKPYNWKR
jgi:hypothetical protein